LFWNCRAARRNAPQRARTRGNAAKTARLSTTRNKIVSESQKHLIEIASLKNFYKAQQKLLGEGASRTQRARFCKQRFAWMKISEIFERISGKDIAA
jgi:hypothetical protein